MPELRLLIIPTISDYAKLVKVLNAIGDLDLGVESFADNKIDAFGDAYEYLMTMYAGERGQVRW